MKIHFEIKLPYLTPPVTADSRMPVSYSENGETYYISYNQVGSPRAVMDTDGNVLKAITYDSFGNIVTDTNPSIKIAFGFAGGLYDSDTKLSRFGYRDYDSRSGKWTSKDPIGLEGGDTNVLAYVGGDPVNFVDPEGLYVWTLLTPTDMGPNTMMTVDKNGNKFVYDFDTGKSKPYWDKKKTYCETGKNDFEDSENTKKNDLERTSKDYRLKYRGKRGEYLENLWDALEAIFG